MIGYWFFLLLRPTTPLRTSRACPELARPLHSTPAILGNWRKADVPGNSINEFHCAAKADRLVKPIIAYVSRLHCDESRSRPTFDRAATTEGRRSNARVGADPEPALSNPDLVKKRFLWSPRQGSPDGHFTPTRLQAQGISCFAHRAITRTCLGAGSGLLGMGFKQRWSGSEPNFIRRSRLRCWLTLRPLYRRRNIELMRWMPPSTGIVRCCPAPWWRAKEEVMPDAYMLTIDPAKRSFAEPMSPASFELHAGPWHHQPQREV